MAATMTSYNAKDCVVTFNSVNITGFSEDMVTGSKDEDDFSSSVGAQGDICVSEINNTLGTVTMVLQATSPQKKALIEAYNDKKVAPLWVKNPSIGERFGGTKARIKKAPDLGHGAEASDREFEFQVFDYTVENVTSSSSSS